MEALQNSVTPSVTDTKRNRKTKARKRKSLPRKTRRFQLRVNHPEDMHVSDILDYSRSKRQEVTIIRNGVALEYSLGQGDYSVLLERHPWLLEALKPLIAPPPDNTDLLNEILANQRKLMEQGITASLPPTGGLTMTGKPIAAPAFALPTFDEDEDELPTLKLSKNTNNDSVKNFLAAMSGIAH